MANEKGVVLSGMRPTGKLHLGNYWGALRNWIELSRDHECFFFVADWHTLTTGYEDLSGLEDNVREMVLDWLAAGLDPARCVIFRQSMVPEHAELALLLGMVTPLSWLENNPTWKEQLQELSRTKHSLARQEAPERNPGGEGGAEESDSAKESLRTFGFLGYPVLQAADILLYQATRVPVGQDQLPHVELAREIARRFNSLYGAVFTEPESLLTPTPKIPGTDGRKMSKSYANAIDLAESPESLKRKVSGMYTDPLKIRAADPGHPEPCVENPPGCSVFALHKIYNPLFEERGVECRAGKIGCVPCKGDLLKRLEVPFGELRERRGELSRDDGAVARVLANGSARARERARRTLARVRRAMGIGGAVS